MQRFKQLLVTQIDSVIVVHSQRGRQFQMIDRHSFGLSLCISGKITYTMNGHSYVSQPGNAVLLPQGGTYALHGDEEGLFPVVNFRCAGLSVTDIAVISLQDPAACLRTFHVLKDASRQNDRLQMFSALYQLLSQISSEGAKKPDPLGPVLQYIETHLSDPTLSNEQLANQLGISEVYLRKLFQKHHKLSPKQYILEVRIRKAKQLLVDTPFTVTAVAEECGFSSLHHFCKVFRSRTGMTPTEYAISNKLYQI